MMTLSVSPVLISVVTAVVVAIMGVIILLGKGDFLISGYNTASPEKKARYNIRRLRIVTATTSWLVALYCLTVACLAEKHEAVVMGVTVLFLILLSGCLVLQYFWVRRF